MLQSSLKEKFMNWGIIVFDLDNYYFHLRNFFWKNYTGFLSYFDPPLKRKKGEVITNYVLRLEKRHALRELDYNIGVARAFNLDAVNAKLQTKLFKRSRKLFELIKCLTEDKYLCMNLREQIRNSSD